MAAVHRIVPPALLGPGRVAVGMPYGQDGGYYAQQSIGYQSAAGYGQTGPAQNAAVEAERRKLKKVYTAPMPPQEALAGMVLEKFGKKALNRRIARYRGQGATWQSQFVRKPRDAVRKMLREPWKFPMASQHLAAIQIQRVVRGRIARKNLRRPRRSESKTASTSSIADTRAKLAHKHAVAAGGQRSKAFTDFCTARIQAWWKMLLVKNEYERHRFSMYHIAAMQVQYAWRDYMRKRFFALSKPALRQNAASKIQRVWRRRTNIKIYRYYRDLLRFRNTGDPAVMLKSINPREAALIDNASGLKVRFRLGGMSFPPAIYYKIFTNRPLIDLGAFAPRDYTREYGVEAAQRHNKPQAPVVGHGPDDYLMTSAADAAGTGALIRAGKKWIPARLSMDVAGATTGAEAATGGGNAYSRKGKGAHASLNVGSRVLEAGDYDQLPDGWYRRIENNGWRPVSLKSLEDAEADPLAKATAAKAVPFHHSSTKRRQDVERRRKEQKRRWLTKMYAEGLAREREEVGGGAIEGKQGGEHDPEIAKQLEQQARGRRKSLAEVINMDSDDWEAEAESLLNWSSALDFDSYIGDWAGIGTSDLPTGFAMKHSPSGVIDDEEAFLSGSYQPVIGTSYL